MSNYQQLYDQAVSTLQKHSLANLIQGIEIAAIHDLMRKHQVKLCGMTSFEQGKELANGILSSAVGMPMQLKAFIKDEADMKLLYGILVAWRDLILKEA